MSSVLKILAQHARRMPESIAIEGETLHISYGALQCEIEALSQKFRAQGYRCLGLLMDNGPAWVVIDLAAMAAGVTLIPIPAFFTTEQTIHALNDAGVTALITDRDERVLECFPDVKLRSQGRIAGRNSWLAQLCGNPPKNDFGAQIAKITYTSGTTGTAKGVCLSQLSMERVAASLRDALHADANDRHLCLLPLAVLLENIGGIYTPLLGGGRCVVPPLASVGMVGAAGLDAKRMYEAIVIRHASSIILLPQMLQALIALVEGGMPVPEQLRFIAVGGAPVSIRLLEQAEKLGLPVYEGYGLSECASVVAVNTPDDHRRGSAGKVLPHARIALAADGEILLGGSLFSGYLNHQPREGEWFASGDLGYVDDAGYLHLTGRKKNCFITSFGRNVAPEWVEQELTLSPAIAQAVVFGETRPFNVAVITPSGKLDNVQIESAVNEANRHLPDYARVSAWITSVEPFSIANGLFTATGHPRREAIWNAYGALLNALYEMKSTA